MNAPRNPAIAAKIGARVAVMRHDLAERGHKLPARPQEDPLFAPRVRVGGREYPRLVVEQGERHLAGDLSFSEICRTYDKGTAVAILSYTQDRDDGLPAPDEAAR